MSGDHRRQREMAPPDARRSEHRTSDASRLRAQQAGAVETRIVFGRGGTRVPTPQGGMRGIQRRAADSPRGITCRSATTAETRPNRTEKRAAVTDIAQRIEILR